MKIPAGQKLAYANIRTPMCSAGVQMSGGNAHLVIRNITATHPYNDGFNIHGNCRDVVFENIRAIKCGDDGISAHESAEYRVDGFVLCSSLDEGKAARTYAMTVFPCSGIYLGYVMMYHVGSGRTVDCGLAWSADSVHWQRVQPGAPFLKLDSKDSYDGGCI